MSSKTVNDIKEDTPVAVSEVQGSVDLKSRLAEIGFIPGSIVSVVKKLSKKGPLALKVRGTTYALRHEDASMIYVTAI